MATTISTKAPCSGLLSSKWATNPSESTTRKTTSPTGLLNSRESTARKTTSPTGLLNSKWAPKSTTTTTTEPTALSPQRPKVTTTTTESTASSPQGPKAITTTSPSEPEQSTKSQDTREPLLELLPATTVQPYQKKSWADLVDEDDNDIIFNLPELNKENFPPGPDKTTEATTTVQKDNEENVQPQPEDDKQTTTTTTTTTTKQAPASMLSSRWSDSSYEIQGAQTRAEYRATHGSTTNNARRNNTPSNRRRRAN